jgi:hypothetical protein
MLQPFPSLLGYFLWERYVLIEVGLKSVLQTMQLPEVEVLVLRT